MHEVHEKVSLENSENNKLSLEEKHPPKRWLEAIKEVAISNYLVVQGQFGCLAACFTKAD